MENNKEVNNPCPAGELGQAGDPKTPVTLKDTLEVQLEFAREEVRSAEIEVIAINDAIGDAQEDITNSKAVIASKKKVLPTAKTNLADRRKEVKVLEKAIKDLG